jgi:hypothetical protein
MLNMLFNCAKLGSHAGTRLMPYMRLNQQKCIMYSGDIMIAHVVRTSRIRAHNALKKVRKLNLEHS